MSSEPQVVEAMLGGREHIRADAGVTILLSETDEYAGGELVVDTGWGDERIKENAGTCIVYPATAGATSFVYGRGHNSDQSPTLLLAQVANRLDSDRAKKRQCGLTNPVGVCSA